MTSAVMVQLAGESERRPICAWCQADAGYCVNTGGRSVCEGEEDRLASEKELAKAPVVSIPIRLGGNR